jgi:hypothetical protein
MRLIRNITTKAFFLIILCQTTDSFGQLGISFDIKKPKEFENRQLRSEKSDKGKFRFPKRAIQNVVTHYNFYFNANNKLNEVLDKAKASFKDDFSKLLPFYNYSLDVTAADTITLDSVSYKSQSGLALHDLRNDWADNLYLLWGASYYFKKQFDSAYLMFQFINYAFAPKEKDGYYVNIGSRMDGNSALSVVSKENNSLPKKLFLRPPSRNDAFIWQIRTFLAQDQLAEAASLIVTLKNDPQFPHRLQDDLDEVQAYWFYKQKMWDSSAAHLVNALDNATNKQERARWEYLLAQLYELSGDYKSSEEYFNKSITHTTNPIMDIYARLFAIRVNKDGGDNYIDRNIATLVRMAKKDKYQDYRDIIYYMAAQMELERNNVDGALALLDKSTRYTSNDPTLRNKAFLQLAELSFGKRLYRQAYNYYDSLRLDDPALQKPDEITRRKELLGRIASDLETIDRQDSLQRIAAMPENERKDFVKKLARQLRKLQGLKEDAAAAGNLAGGNQAAPPPLFADNNAKGEWYFYNTNSRQKGLQDFKSRWGNRPNQDNWRRSAAVTAIARGNRMNNASDPALRYASNKQPEEPTEITFESLYDKLPLTDELKKLSNDSLKNAMFDLGIAYIQGIEDCTVGTQTLEDLRTRFPDHPKMDEILFNLYYCYDKNGDRAHADSIKALLNQKFGTSRYATIVTTGKDPESKNGNTDATHAYERIYDLFLEGNFQEALAQKKIADSLYSSNYWNPQLLYIESVYFIKQRQDSAAKSVLNDIINRFPRTPLAVKATTMIDVLNRRNQIEEELRNLVIKMPDTTQNQVQQPVLTTPPPVAMRKDTTRAQKDTVKVQKPIQPPIVNKPADTTGRKTTPVQTVPTAYAYNPETPHYVVIVMSKIDPVYVNEARNAFANYNRNTYFNKQMSAELIPIDADNRLLLISPFRNAQEAIDYVDKTRPVTSTQIVPWLKGGKYSFSIINDKNLELLKNTKNLEEYRQFLDKNVPGKF